MTYLLHAKLIVIAMCNQYKQYVFTQSVETNIFLRMDCWENTTHSMSQICLEGWEQGNEVPDHCYPEWTLDERTFICFSCIFNGVLGTLGNLLTLTAIPYATSKNK